ncbi:DUF2079 domain-containing protein [Methanosarcina siciliae]|nr:DUF2079 domain-containing protein [Methanosarcina siciliae]
MWQHFFSEKLVSYIGKPIHIYVAAYAIIFFLLSSLGLWLQLNGKITPEIDTFWFDNIFYNTIQGNGFFHVSPNHYSVSEIYRYPNFSHFHQHNQPILLFVLPIYYLFPSVYTLLCLQAILIGVGAIPLYFIGKETLDETSGKIIAISYLLYPTVMWNTILFHPITFAPFFIFSMVYFYMKDKIGLFILSLFFSLILKENVPLVLFPLGVYLLYDFYNGKYFSPYVSNRWKYFLLLLVLTPAYFILSFKIVIPYFTGGEYVFAGRYAHLGSSFSEILTNFVEKPSLFISELVSKEALSYFLQLLLPVSFVPLLSIATLSIGIPILLQNLLSSSFAQICFIAQYQFNLIPVIFLSVIVGFVKIKRKRNETFKKYMISYFHLTLAWCIVFSLIRFFILISPEPLF